MTYEEKKQQTCKECRLHGACAYVVRNLQDDCPELQVAMDNWEIGYAEGVADTCKWLEDHLWEYDQGYVNRIDADEIINDMKKAMNQKEER